MKKILVLGAGLFIMLSVFSACRKETGNGPVTLSVVWFNDNNESEIFERTMKDYLDAHPNIKLDIQLLAYSDYDQKLKLMISGGNPPDIARLTTGSIVLFADQCLPLDSYISDLNELKKGFMPSMLEFANNSQGELIAFPSEATGNGMLVNKTAFKNAGIDVDVISREWTWDQWQDETKKVISANPNMKYGLALDFTIHRFATILYQFGGHFLNTNQTGMAFASPENINAINFFKSITDNGLVTPSVWLGSENASELFQAGLVACHIGGSWNILSNNNNIKDFEWGAVRNPIGTTRSSVPGGKFIASFKGSKYPAEAVDFIKVFSDKKHLSEYVRDTFNMTSRVDLSVEYSSNTQDFAVFAEDLGVTPSYTAAEFKNPAVMSIQPYVREQIVEVLQEHITAEQAAANIDKEGAKYFN
ncbi:MAG: sugar ABC transporter substrate-binding protein [Treponema sp.]|jgi:alpha-1,4-digalacturonate transport system substrate-binding protein|nr:sugar ABC transporter substrate-binding protein [Treponema sp.]